ncbi:Chromosome partition protein Smc [Posidoniimonas corsicana]|uniref:Chromosome partition protein Smc n=1 Tax=Posidoniimonas corsicana TaxID=1938618 RepID=A0A5C5VHU4_9BACT|nr:AAA family ATPase [Posidoniimonas corsicana]TWT37557.1 Chromosome partition protein Smc [Posidoniimonas corsicana]
MRITDLHVDGFGVWHDLRLNRLSPEITVFYGPNEAGKTTLMQFMRTMLYGVSADRRERYLPPREGGKPGGRMGLESEAGRFEATRYAERDKDDRGRVTVFRPDGETEGDRLLREALEGVDEATYNNVFSVGLDEIQSLGALSGDEVAKAIYRLTSGLDRVSLYDVIQGLESSRRKLLAPQELDSVIGGLVGRRDTLLTEISDLSAQGRRWAKIAVEIDELGVSVDDAHARLKDAERAARRLEIAINLKPQWTERAKIDERLLGYAGLHVLGEGAIEELDELNEKIEEHARQRDMLRGQRKQVRQEADELGVNEVLMRSCCRLDALGEQAEWIEALEREAEDGDAELNKLVARIDSETARLAAMWSHDPDEAPELTREMVDELEPQGRAIAAAESAAAEAREQLDRKRNSERSYQSKIETAMAAGGKMGLPTDINEAGELVARLRRRQQAEHKLELAERHARELEEQNFELEDRQVIPLEGFFFMGGLFMVGVLVCGWWLLNQETAFVNLGGGWFALAGLALSIGVWMYKYYREDNAAEELDGCERQMEVAAKQIKEAQRDLKALSAELNITDGSASLQLQHAERHLAELEQTLPVETQRRQASEEVAAAEAEYDAAKQRLADTLQRWTAALASLGLPDSITPKDLAAMAGQYEQLAEWQLKAENRQDEVDRRAREYERVTQRIAALAEEADLVVDEATPLEQLEALLSERRLQQGRIDHRKKLMERGKALKEKQARHSAEIDSLEAHRDSLFRTARCEDEDAYRRLADKLAEAEELRERRQRVTAEIAAAIGRLGTEDDFAPLLAEDQIGQLDAQWQTLIERHEEIEAELRGLQSQQGALTEQQKSLGQDVTIADKRMELGEVEAQLAQAGERWRERAAIGQMLELIRSDYEANRQPETLVEASRYMEQLTDGRYTRVWTPLANDILLVDNRDGQSIAVEALSRGTREQLFLSVRLALVAMYARRGIQLPMVLDDILVNFDAGRSRTAAKVMINFAKAGHQLFVFTCHEHVWEIFKNLNADVRRLPSREDGVVEQVEEEVEEIIEETLEPEPVVEPAPAPVEVVEAEPAAVEAHYLDLQPEERVERHEYLEAVYEELAPRAERVVVESEVDYEFPRAEPAAEPEEIEYRWDERGESNRYDYDDSPLSQRDVDVYAVVRR